MQPAQILKMPRRGGPGRALTLDGRERFKLYPSEVSGAALYACGFVDGRTKIGITARPCRRLIQHWIASDGGVIWSHLFAAFPSRVCAQIERRAVALAADLAPRIRQTEYFVGLTRDDAIACVRMAMADTKPSGKGG